MTKDTFLRRASRNGQFLFGVAIVTLYLLLAIFAPILAPNDPLDMVTRPFLQPWQNAAFLLGSDSVGRDIFAGVVHGSRVALLVGITSTVIAMSIGVFVGAFAGYFGGWADDLLTRITEVFQTIPPFIFVIVMVAILGPSPVSTTIAISVIAWPMASRIIRAEFRSLRERDFVLAARSLGFGPMRIVIGEILPNAIAPLLAVFSVMVATAILIDSGLSFLGLVDPNLTSWGWMIAEGRAYLRSNWYISTVPGFALALAVLGFNALGDGLNDLLNPRLRKREG